MTIKQAIFLILALALTACSAHVQKPGGVGHYKPDTGDGDSESGFVTPIDVRFTLSRNDPLRPQLCSKLPGRSQCPTILTGGRNVGGIPTIEPTLTANLPNARVSFVVQEISNEVVEGDGVETFDEAEPTNSLLVTWLTTSTAADFENTGPFSWSLPSPGEIMVDIGHSGGSAQIYDALVLNACESFSSFPVEHSATVARVSGDADLGEFNGVDNSTLDATGFYNLNYTVRAEDEDGNVSNFHFSGKVNVTCSGLNSL